MTAPKMVQPTNAVGSGSYIEQVKARRRINTTFGEKTKTGETAFNLPPWFTRTGKVSFEIDTGFGTLKCQLPDFRVQRQMETVDAELERLSLMDPAPVAEIQKVTRERDVLRVRATLRMLRGIPADWVHEGDETLVMDTLRIEPGMPLPQPSAVLALKPEAADVYLTALPPSLIAQVWGAHEFMGIPPLYYDEVRNPSPS